MYQVKFKKQAEKSFDQIMQSQPKMGQRLANAIDELAQKPDLGIPLRNELKGLHKYRVGSYRIIYQILRSQLIVMVIDIGHRREIYR